MTIEATKLDTVISYPARSANAAVSKASAITSSNALAADTSTTTAVDVNTIEEAVQQIQSHLSGLTDPPQFSVDYLSGLDVMTVRAASTGEVVFQSPGTTAVRLAQLIKEGTSIDSFGTLNATV